MSIALSNKTIEKYLSFLTKLDNSSKKKLIIELTESIETGDEGKFDLHSLFGAWIDDKDSDEIIKEIRESRVEKQTNALTC
jgi:hypothetical protein